MLQLHPRESFSIVRQIEDHTDTATYYVRAVIRNAKTDAVIQVNGNNYLNLTDRGSQRFSENWLVPADGGGQGFWISILTSVYTDSGYTTKSQNYGDKMETYLIQERFNQNLGGYGGGADIDYKRVRKIVEEVVKENKPEMPDIPRVIEVIKEKVIMPKVDIPEYPSFAPLLKAIKEAKKAIDEKKIPEPEKVNLMPVVKSLAEAVDDLKKTGEEVNSKSFKDLLAKMESESKKLYEKLDNLKVEVSLTGLMAEMKEKNKEPILDPRITKILTKKIVTGADLKQQAEDILDSNADWSDDFFYQLLNIAKNKLEEKRLWQYLKKCNSSNIASSSAIPLPDDLAEEYKITVGQDTEYYPVPFEEKEISRNVASRYYIDWANSNLYLLGSSIPSKTLYIFYKRFTDDIASGTSPVFPARFHPLLTFYVVAYYQVGVDSDDIFARMSPHNRLMAKELEDQMTAWDATLAMRSQNNQVGVANAEVGVSLENM